MTTTPCDACHRPTASHLLRGGRHDGEYCPLCCGRNSLGRPEEVRCDCGGTISLTRRGVVECDGCSSGSEAA